MAEQVFRRWDVSQGELFPPTFQELVPEGHLVHFVRRLVVEDLDLGAIYAKYTETKRQPPYDPRMTTALLCTVHHLLKPARATAARPVCAAV